MTNTVTFNESDLNTAEKESALKELYQAIVCALNRLSQLTKVTSARLKDWLKAHGDAVVQKFKTSTGVEYLLISAGAGLFVGSVVYNTIVAVSVHQTLVAMSALAAKFILTLVGAGAGAVIASLAGISAIGIVPLGAGISGVAFLASLGGIGGYVGGSLLGGGMLAGALSKAGAVTAIAASLTATPAIAPAAAIGIGLAAAGATLLGIKKLFK